MKPKKNYRLGPNDLCQTPGYAIEPLTRVIRQFNPEWQYWRIWECASGEGIMADALTKEGFNVEVKSDLFDRTWMEMNLWANQEIDLNNLGYQLTMGMIERKDLPNPVQHDFLNDPFNKFPVELADTIITNPPYSLKKEFMTRCIETEKRWALIMPTETVSLAWFEELVRDLTPKPGIVWFNPRVNFKMPEKGWKGSGSQFPTAWFTWGMGFSGNIWMRMNWTKEYRKRFEI